MLEVIFGRELLASRGVHLEKVMSIFAVERCDRLALVECVETVDPER